jgi:murein DD-endopeptidase MepM/ murein hydrolase activator NlpD
LDGNGQLDVEDSFLASQIHGRPEKILLDALIKPADSAFNPFGGRMTSDHCDIPGRPSCSARHPGVDSHTGAANRGDTIYAAAYGRVVQTGAPPGGAFDGQGAAGGFGHFVIIEHDVYGVLLYSIYAHNGTVLVNEGDIVGAGAQIATMGNSGTGTVHLHFEIRRATNIDLGADNPFVTQMYWPSTVTELRRNFVDLGPVFGYHSSYANWAKANP